MYGDFDMESFDDESNVMKKETGLDLVFIFIRKNI